MTKSTIAVLVVALAGSGIQTAQAGDKEKYLIGGLIGGWILNEVVDRPDRHHSSVQVHTYSSPVTVERSSHPHRPAGRYEYQHVKTWVPGYYERIRRSCGRVETRWIPGHYEVRTEKVWVSYGHHSSRQYGRDRCSLR